MILGKHILPLSETTWLLVMVDAATDKVIYVYDFTTKHDAENAAALATNMYNAPVPIDLTYDQLIHDFLQLVNSMNAQETIAQRRTNYALLH